MTSPEDLHGDIQRIEEAAGAVPYEAAAAATEKLGFAALISGLESVQRLAEAEMEGNQQAGRTTARALDTLEATVCAPLTAMEATSTSDLMADGYRLFIFSADSLDDAHGQLLTRHETVRTVARKIQEVLDILTLDGDPGKRNALQEITGAIDTRNEGVAALQNYRRST